MKNIITLTLKIICIALLALAFNAIVGESKNYYQGFITGGIAVLIAEFLERDSEYGVK